ncbi:hypothetical protein DQW13_04055, partial [Taylorella equigenitalis]
DDSGWTPVKVGHRQALFFLLIYNPPKKTTLTDPFYSVRAFLLYFDKSFTHICNIHIPLHF